MYASLVSRHPLALAPCMSICSIWWVFYSKYARGGGGGRKGYACGAFWGHDCAWARVTPYEVSVQQGGMVCASSSCMRVDLGGIVGYGHMGQGYWWSGVLVVRGTGGH
jgi:hypothetical protein